MTTPTDTAPETAACQAYQCGKPYDPAHPQDHWTTHGHMPPRELTFRVYASGATGTGHLHSTRTPEAADRWAQHYRDQGYTGVHVVAATH